MEAGVSLALLRCPGRGLRLLRTAWALPGVGGPALVMGSVGRGADCSALMGASDWETKLMAEMNQTEGDLGDISTS